jgi:hypothetical protein
MSGLAATVVIRGNEAAWAQTDDLAVNLVRGGRAELARSPDELADLWRCELIKAVTRSLEEVVCELSSDDVGVAPTGFEVVGELIKKTGPRRKTCPARNARTYE